MTDRGDRIRTCDLVLPKHFFTPLRHLVNSHTNWYDRVCLFLSSPIMLYLLAICWLFWVKIGNRLQENKSRDLVLKVVWRQINPNVEWSNCVEEDRDINQNPSSCLSNGKRKNGVMLIQEQEIYLSSSKKVTRSKPQLKWLRGKHQGNQKIGGIS